MSNHDIKIIMGLGPHAVTASGRGIINTRVSGVGVQTVSSIVEGAEGGSPIPDPPLLLTSPTLSGYVVPGYAVTCTPGTYSGADSVTRQWQRDGFDIPGETGLTYSCVQADVLQSISVVETASNAGGSVSQTSLPAQDAIQALRADSSAVALFASLGDYMAETASGSLGLTPGAVIGRIEDVLYGVSLTSSGSSRPQWLVGRAHDGIDDRLELDGAFAQEIAPARTVIASVRYDAVNTNNPVYSLARASDALPFVRGGAGAPSLTSGASTIRATGRGDNGSIRTVITNSSRNPVGSPTAAPWSLRWRHSVTTGNPGTQTLTEIQPDSGTASADKFQTLLLDRFCEGASVTTTSFTQHVNAVIYATAYFSTATPLARSIAAVNALYTHWGFP